MRCQDDGRYLYCIINSLEETSFGCIGISDSEVYTVPYRDVAALVHSCRAEPYSTNYDEKAAEWILAHNYVVDSATRQFGTVLPFSFDCIIKGNDDDVKNWLRRSYEKLRGELESVRNKAEYSVQIFYENQKLKEKLVHCRLKELEDKKMSKGAAYLLQRRFEIKAKDAISKEMLKHAVEFNSMIKEHVEELRIEKKPSQVPEKYRGKKLIAAFSCLVVEEKVDKLGEVLDEINKREGFAVRFTGPWAPFSFVGLEEENET